MNAPCVDDQRNLDVHQVEQKMARNPDVKMMLGYFLVTPCTPIG